MLKFKIVLFLKYRSDLFILFEGKLLINIINVYLYNIVLKDVGFVEVLFKGGVLIFDGVSMVLVFRWF